MSPPPSRAARRAGSTAFATRCARVARLFVHLLRGLLVTTFVFPFAGDRRRARHVEHWSRALLKTLNVRLHVRGAQPVSGGRPALVVGNHVSWLDIFMLDAVMHVRFVGKAEIRRWPLIGWLSTRAGTMYIQRSRKRDTGRINHLVRAALEARRVCAVFPEGTTTAGDRVARFHASLLQPAVLAGADIWPVAIRFSRPDGSLCTEAAYDGDKTLLDTLRLMLGQPRIDAELRFLEPIPADGLTRKELAEAARAAITSALFPADPNT